MDVFNNREIAIAIWIALFAGWMIAKGRKSPSLGKALVNLLKVFSVRPILISLGLMSAYIGLLVYVLHEVGVWNIGQLKNTIIWSASVAAVSLFRVNKIVEDPHYFKNAIKDNLKLVAVLEFIVGFYTFELWIELLIVPVTTVIGGMLAIAGSEQKYQPVKKLLNGLLAIFGGVLIVYAAYNLITDFWSFARPETLADFALPPTMSFLFLPFLYVLSVYVNYENAFAKVRFTIADPALRFYAKRRAIFAFHLRTELLKRWARNLAISRPGTRNEVDAAIAEVKKIRARERDPEAVPLERGWSPFEAMSFLVSEGLATGDYHRAAGDDEEWWAGSPYLEIDEGIMPNNLTYYVDGNEAAATALKLVLNVNEPQNAAEAQRKLVEAARVLYEKALGDRMPEEVAAHLSAGIELVTQAHGKEIAVSKELWPAHRSGGHTIKFSIRSPVDA